MSERASLVQARETLRSRCAEAGPTDLEVDIIRSPSARAFATYLAGARQFYAGDFQSALNSFRNAAGSQQPWVRETASYMMARTILNQAQQSSFDEYGSLAEPAKRDMGMIDAAGRGFAAYLQAYPQGRYAASAKGLLRRVALLDTSYSKTAPAPNKTPLNTQKTSSSPPL